MSEILHAVCSRRTFLGGALGASVLTLAPALFAQPAAGTFTGVAFSGDAVFVLGQRVLRSADQGASWAAIASPTGRPVAVTSHPATPGRLVVSLDGGGVDITDDDGRSWRRLGKGLPNQTIGALATSAQEPDTLYAAIAGDGLWRSENAGETWEFVMDRPFIAEQEQDVRALASVDLASGMGGIWLYAGTAAGVQRVPDCFCRWQDVQPPNALDALVEGEEAPAVAPLPEGEPVNALVSCAAAPERLYAALPSGIWASADAGAVWQRTAALPANALAVDPTDPETLVAATPDGLSLSRDGGASWTRSEIL